MSDLFYRLPIERLLSWMLKDLKQTDYLFGIHRDLFYQPKKDAKLTSMRYAKRLETPLGVAAGPHSQLAQNLIVAWLTGSRYMELKTVQTLDELKVSKPCIDMGDEGYNCEWSQELKLSASADEYVNAWILIHILQSELNWGHAADSDPGFIFNLSVGYNLQGILNANVQRFLDEMLNAESMIKEKIEQLAGIYPKIREIAIGYQISNNVTLSTMHGCPPEEIEKIGLYLLRDRRLHTTIKLNPTLLGKERLREVLQKCHGFDVEVPDSAFEHDLKFPDAVNLIKNLQLAADASGVSFGLKLTNTLECVNKRGRLPANEKMNYMSGRALHPISILVAQKLQNEFAGKLDISFAGGADSFNIIDIIRCGMRPVTVCSDFLKPAGYSRTAQYLDLLESWEGSSEFLAQNDPQRNVANLALYADKVITNRAYTKTALNYFSIKTTRQLTTFDCIKAPCSDTCPANQDIPRYLRQVASGDFSLALATILRTNPLPMMTGMACDHSCQTKCTRLGFDEPLLIREIKRFVTANAGAAPTWVLQPANGQKVAVIGAGPAGLVSAFYLALAGFSVDVFESSSSAGGMPAAAIPRFRLTDAGIHEDLQRIVELGVKFHYGEKIDKVRFTSLRLIYDFVNIAIGAQRAKKLGLKGEDALNVTDQLTFLSRVRRGENPGLIADGIDQITFLDQVRRGESRGLGVRIGVIGGGNSAIDAARTARRLINAGGKVTIFYRRSRAQMPADPEEILAMLEEGIELIELVSPVRLEVEDRRLRSVVFQRMRLTHPDESGRRQPVAVENSQYSVPLDLLISAVGQEVVADFLQDDQELVAVNSELETALKNVFISGDALRGPANIIGAVADGRRVAEAIIKRGNTTELTLADGFNVSGQLQASAPIITYQPSYPSVARNLNQRLGVKRYPLQPRALPAQVRAGDFDLVTKTLSKEEAMTEAARCLGCDEVCAICVSVCPNRANVSYRVKTGTYKVARISRQGDEIIHEADEDFIISQPSQVANIGDFCNECGNCTTFCPTRGDPYRDKPKIYLSAESFKGEIGGYFCAAHGIRGAFESGEELLSLSGDIYVYKTTFITAELNRNNFAIEKITFHNKTDESISFKQAVIMGVLHEGLKNAGFVD